MSSIRFLLPLATLAISAVFAAAEGFCQEIKNPGDQRGRSHGVVASARLTGTREFQQVVTWQDRGIAYLAVRTAGSNPRVLWQTGGPDAGLRVDSVRISDLDADGVPEIISLWRRRASNNAVLRVFHWDGQNSFAEIQSDISRITGYRLVRIDSTSASRIVINARSDNGTSSGGVTYELRGSRLTPVGGGQVVPTQVESGIEGQAIISPTRPGPTREGVPNSSPYKTTLVVWGAGDREVARFETGSDGRFRVALAPGTYRIGPPPATGRFLPRAGEEMVTVERGKYAQVTINFDSGMR